MLTSFIVTSLLFTSTAITFWTTNYITKVLKYEEHLAEIVFISITSITLGGLIVQKCFNGYEAKHSIIVPLIGLSLTCISIPSMYFVNNLILFAFNLWSLLFLGDLGIPTLQGINISSLPSI